MIFQLIVMILMPPVVLVVLKQYEKKNRQFSNSKYKPYIAGVLFGLVAIYGTECGVSVNGAIINTRDAAVICSGFAFGPVAAMISALIGSIERYLAPLWGVGEYTRLACSLATFFAGVFVSLTVGKFFDRNHPKWYHAVVYGVVIEVFHMLMVFVTHQKDLDAVFTVVISCSVYMILFNTVSATLGFLILDIIEKKRIKLPDRKNLDFKIGLFIAVAMVVGFLITFGFTILSQRNLSVSSTEKKLRASIEDTKGQFNLICDKQLIEAMHFISQDIDDVEDAAVVNLSVYLNRYGLTEVLVVGKDGTVRYSTDKTYIGYDMDSNEQSRVFNDLIDNPDATYVQDYVPMGIDSTKNRKFAGLGLSDGGYIQVSLDYDKLSDVVKTQIEDFTKHRRIGEKGYVIIALQDGSVISDSGDYKGRKLEDMGLSGSLPVDTITRTIIKGDDSYYIYSPFGEYDIVAVLPVSEVMYSAGIAITMELFLEILLFALLYIILFLAIKYLVTVNLDYVARNLKKISAGDLDVKLDIKGTHQFESLSSDINKTVDELKKLIQKEKTRIDTELEFARQIQYGSLISHFPAFSENKTFDIYASMRTAKEVGGDFYDFCLVNNTKLYFMIADVAGKGIPAALFMMRAKAVLKDLAVSEKDVAEIYHTANNLLCEDNHAGLFVTSWLGCLDINTGKVTFVNAGHNYPLLISEGQPARYLDNTSGLVLAAMEDSTYESFEIQLQKGDSILLYTDGITEAENENLELYGENRLCELMSSREALSPKQICMDVQTAADAFAGKNRQFDDMTLLCLQFLGKEL